MRLWWLALLLGCEAGTPLGDEPANDEASCGDSIGDPGEECDAEVGCTADCRWQREWVSTFDEHYFAVAVMPDDALLLAGSVAGGDAVTARVRSDGDTLWSHKHSFLGAATADWRGGSGFLRGAQAEERDASVFQVDDRTGGVRDSWVVSNGPNVASAVAWSPLGRGYALWREIETGVQHLAELLPGEPAAPVDVTLPWTRSLTVDSIGNLWLVGEAIVTVVDRLGAVQFVVEPPGDPQLVAHDRSSDLSCVLWMEPGVVTRYGAAWVRRGNGPDVEIRRGEEDLAAVAVAAADGRCYVQLLVQDPVTYTAWFETIVVGDRPLQTWTTEPTDFEIFPTGSIAVTSTGAVITAEHFFDRDAQRNASRLRVRVFVE